MRGVQAAVHSYRGICLFRRCIGIAIKEATIKSNATTSCSFMHTISKQKENSKLNATQANCARRNISLSPIIGLQLKDGKSHAEWDQQYWIHASHDKAVRVRKGMKFESLHALKAIRKFSFVLTKEGSNVTFSNKEEEYGNILESSDVIAYSHVLVAPRGAWVIENKYNTIEEWEANMKTHLALGDGLSRNIMLTSIMDFTLNAVPQIIKIDKNVDETKLHCSPLMESLLEYIFSEKNVEYCQRPLSVYMISCAYYNRYDLISKVYRRAKHHVKIFAPDFMDICRDYLNETEYVKDNYGFIDILKAWDHGRKSVLLLSPINVALKSGDLESAVAHTGNALNAVSGWNTVTSFDSIIPNFLQAFSYNNDKEIWSRNRELVEVLLKRMANLYIFPNTEEVAKCIGEWFTSIKNEHWEYALLHSNDIRGQTCPFTKVQLKKKELKDEEYDYLRAAVFKKIIQDRTEINEIVDSYNKTPSYVGTHPSEVKSFLSVVYENGPFDLVVDGLNLVYFFNNQMKKEGTPISAVVKMTDAWLRNYVNTKEKEYGRKLNVLVVARRHILFGGNKGAFTDFATVWCAGNDTHDDPYFLYAALISGRRCSLITLDLMKDLAFKISKKLDYKVSYLIYKWQQIHQDLVLSNVARSMRKETIDVSIQRTANSWHIPYYPELKAGPVPVNWLCLKRIK